MKEKVLRYSDPRDGVHPQVAMKRLGLDNYYKCEAHPIGDCWFFFFKEWPEVELPEHIAKIEIDRGPVDVVMELDEMYFCPGDLVREIDTGREGIVEYDFHTGFGYNGHTIFAIAWLDESGRVVAASAWECVVDFELVDTSHHKENCAKIREFYKGHEMPHYLSKDMARLYYGWEEPSEVDISNLKNATPIATIVEGETAWEGEE